MNVLVNVAVHVVLPFALIAAGLFIGRKHPAIANVAVADANAVKTAAVADANAVKAVAAAVQSSVTGK